MKDPTRIHGDVEQARRVLAADERWIAAFNRADVETIVSIYAPDVVLMPPDAATLHGRDAVATFMREFFRDHAAQQTLTNDEAFAEGNLAVIHGRFSLEITERATDRKRGARGKHLVVWRRQVGGEWLATHDIWNLGSVADGDASTAW